MKYNSVVIVRIPGSREMEFGEGKDENLNRLFESAKTSIADRSAEIVHTGEFELEENRVVFNNTRGLATYILFPFMGGVDAEDNEALWGTLQRFMEFANYPTLVDKTYNNQVIRLEYIDASTF